LGNKQQDNSQLHRLTMSENIAKSLLVGSYFLTHIVEILLFKIRHHPSS